MWKYLQRLLFVAVIITLPLQAQGISGGVTVPVSFAVALLFVAGNSGYVAYWRRPDIYDIVASLFVLLGLISTFRYALVEGIPSGGERTLRGGWLRLLIHGVRFIGLFAFYKLVKEYTARCEPLALRRFRSSVVLIAVILCVFGVYQWVGIPRGWPLTNLNNIHGERIFPTTVGAGIVGGIRVHATFGEPKGYGMFLLFLLPILGGVWYGTWRKMRRRLLGLIIGVLVVQFVLTMSRGAFVGAVAGLILAIVIGRGRWALLLGTVLGICWLGLFGFSVDRALVGLDIVASSYTQPGDTPSIVLEMTENVWAWVVQEAPIIGQGFGALVYNSEIVNRGIPESVNRFGAGEPTTYLPAATGIVGTVVFLLFVGMHAAIGALNVRGLLRCKEEGRMRERDLGRLSLQLYMPLLFSTVMVWTDYMLIGGWNVVYPWLALGMLAGIGSRMTSATATQDRRMGTAIE